MPTVSVVIPALNAARTLPFCLAAMARLDPAPAEIVLVDNGSTDGTLALLQAFERDHAARGVRTLHEGRRGAAAARNAGIRAATGDVIAFTDADCAPEPEWLRLLSGPLAEPAVGAVAGRVVAAPPGSTLELFSALYTLQLPERPARTTHWTPWEGGYPTANLAVRRRLLEELAGFDESVGTYGEDYDLCARVYARGAQIVYAPEARVAHHHRTTLAGMWRQAFGIGRGHPYLLHRHVRRGLWLNLPRWPVVCTACPVRAWVDLASADKKVLALLALGAAYGPALWLLPLYAAWLAAAARRRAARGGAPIGPLAALELAGLLLVKSGAMTAGRWWGSMRYGAICL